MPNFKEITPSIESEQPLNKKITVVSRTIAVNSIVNKHTHDWGQFVYACKGVLVVSTPFNRYVVPPEQGVWILPGVEHEVTALSDVQLTSFYFDNKFLNELPAKCCVLKVNNFLKALIKEANNIDKNYQWDSADGRLLHLVLDKLSQAPCEVLQVPYPKDARLLAVFFQINNAPDNNNTLTQWGKVVGASARTLSRLFKKETGMKYSEWRQRLNIQIAITQLSLGNSVHSVSLHLGYESPSSFIYMFKNKVGVTPSYYREKGNGL